MRVQDVRVLDLTWTSPAATTHSYELLARCVMPVFQGSLPRQRASAAWMREVAAQRRAGAPR